MDFFTRFGLILFLIGVAQLVASLFIGLNHLFSTGSFPLSVLLYHSQYVYILCGLLMSNQILVSQRFNILKYFNVLYTSIYDSLPLYVIISVIFMGIQGFGVRPMIESVFILGLWLSGKLK